MHHSSLLEGDIRRQLITLSIPLLLGNVLQQLYNTADSLIIGHFLGTDAFAAAGIAGTVMNLFIFVLNGFCTGLSVIFAQFYGGGEKTRFRQEVFVSLAFGSILSLVLSALFIAVLHPLLRLIQTPETLLADTAAYLTIIIIGMIAVYFYNLFSSILRAVGDTRAALYFLALSVAVNVAADWWLVRALGIAGAALATVLAQLLSALCCWCYLLHRYRELICRRQDTGIHRELLGRTIRFGFTAALQQSSLYIGKILVQGAVNTLSTPGIAAYTAAMRIEGFANSFGDSSAQATSIFISQNHGAGQSRRVRDGLRQGMRLHVALGVALSFVLFLIAQPGTAVFLGSSEAAALAYGSAYLRTITVFYVLCFAGSTFVGYFRGIGHIGVTVAGTTLQIAIRVVLSYLLVGRLGLSAVALSTGVGWICIVIFQTISYRRICRTASAASS